jgi:trehalose 6-phosphate phosphatase
VSGDAAELLAEAVRARIEPGSSLLIALDFDGTLTEIQDEPDAPRLSDERRRILARVPDAGHWLAILSGRALSHLRMRTRIERAICVGNHGMEIAGAGLDERLAPAATASRLASLLASLPALDGTWIEDKGLTASVHVRPRHDCERHAQVGQAFRPAVERAGFALRSGKAVWEIRPLGAPTKGDALCRLMEVLPGVEPWRTVFVGDDTTDEDAFAVLPEGITALVGPAGRTTRASHRLPDPPAVYRFLELLVEVARVK